ncbi:methyl-accepting chemotaxis protein [Enterovibrio sp. ZSDZ35]|uniref:Methyl-accepting chemotaxis protein n=1 Tax=Enterovibrio qingdaonensis TaxID=2899818 RepID=A0ABT5QHK0_9GAMM|nr:methyl-accepting chemotaxis protein [Enterovibrio sp. ZSDZ35]MDD1779970.1 methyl-accepting chemotaxis protein [Enterovibrio sp. ZSDZ35]
MLANWKREFENFALVKKVTIILCLIGLIPTILTALIGLYSASNSLEEEKSGALQAIAHLKGDAIETYFENTNIVIQSIAHSPDIISATTRLKNGFSQYPKKILTASEKASLSDYYTQQFLPSLDINKEEANQLITHIKENSDTTKSLQHAYIANNTHPIGEKSQLFQAGNSEYDFAHGRFHKDIKQYADKFGFYDVFLVGIDTGDIFYTVNKKIDFATNLNDGPLKDSGLAKAYQMAASSLNDDNAAPTAFVDYSQYLPALNAPASFIATPVFDKGVPIAVLAVQIPLSQVTAVMEKDYGLGETGESFVVGTDKRLRSDTFHDKDLTVYSSFQHDKIIDTDAINYALNSDEIEPAFALHGDNYLNHDAFTVFHKVSIGKDTQWIVIVEQETGEALSAIYSLELIYLLVAIILVSSILFIAKQFGRLISAPIEDLSNFILQLKQNWLFSSRAKIHSKDETGQAAEALNGMLASLNVAVSDISGTMKKLSEGDFSQRITTNLTGDLATLKNSINDSAEEIDVAVRSIGDVMARIEQGDFKQQITTKAKGQLAQLKNQVNSSAKSTAAFVADAKLVMSAMEQGDYNKRITAPAAGELASLKESINSSMTNTEAVVNNICEVMAEMGKGHFDRRVHVDAKGKLDEMKQAVNHASSSTNSVITSIVTVMEQVTDGNFSARCDARTANGDLLKLASSVNQSTTNLEQTLSHTRQVLGQLSQGNLTENFSLNVKGDYVLLKRDINDTISRLAQMLEEIQSSAKTVNVKSDETFAEVTQLNQQFDIQVKDLKDVSLLMKAMRSNIDETLDHANVSVSVSQKALEHAHENEALVKQIEGAMRSITDSSRKMQQIISTIEGISFQTNLLALNASVEAARAGDQGRGFSVVAGEVRDLAQRSSDAAKEISALIKESDERVTRGAEQVNLSGDLLKKITASSNEVCANFELVNVSIKAQFDRVKDASEGVESVGGSIQQSANILNRIQDNMNGVSDQADNLNTMIGRFSY